MVKETNAVTEWGKGERAAYNYFTARVLLRQVVANFDDDSNPARYTLVPNKLMLDIQDFLRANVKGANHD